MKLLKVFIIGFWFGIVLIKSQVISWFRIQEMFHFHDFHMYGVIMSAIATGFVSIFLLKKLKLKSFRGEEFNFKSKPFNKIGNITGGILFGLGWSITGACPGPLYALVGNGALIYVIGILAAFAGVVAYGVAIGKN